MTRWLYPLACLAALGLVAGAYAGSLENDFHFDDSHVVVNNVYLRTLRNVPRFFADALTFSSQPANATYRPLVSASLAVDHWLAGGLRKPVFHLSQLLQLVALGAALLVFYRRLFDECVPAPANRWLALFGASWFCLHTAQTETMNLMHARSEILSGLGVVGAFLVAGATPSTPRALVACLPMIAGALAKAPAVLFGPLLAARLGLRELAAGGRGRRLFAAIWPAVPATMLGAAVFLFLRSMDAPTQTYGGGHPAAYALTQLWVWVHYLRLFVLPVGLSADTDWNLFEHWYDTRAIAGALILGALALLAWRWARHPRLWPAAFGLAWFAISLLPTSSVLPLAETLNEHRIFLPYIGLVIATIWAGWRALADRAVAKRWVRAAVAAGIALLLAHAAGTIVRNRVWRDAETLWADTTRKSPGNGRAWMNYGLALMGRGDYPGARRAFEFAQPLVPRYSVLEVNLGVLSAAQNKPQEAETHFLRALSLSPGDPASHVHYARWLLREGRGPEALTHYREAVRLAPAGPEARARLADLEAARGSVEEARRIAAESLRLDPADARARAYVDGGYPVVGEGAFATYEDRLNAGMRLSMADALASALGYRAALQLRPDSSDALNNLGWTLGKLGFFGEAVAPLEQALRLRPDFDLARNNLAWVRSKAAAPAK